MLIGNGYQPGHAQYALDLVRTEPGLRELFERRLTERPRGDTTDRRGTHATRPHVEVPLSTPPTPTPTPTPAAPIPAGPAAGPGPAAVSAPAAGPGPAAVTAKLRLDAHLVRRARELAVQVGRPVVDLARSHTTVAVERASLRLAGLSGADREGIPWVNRLVDVVRDQVGLEHGIALPVWHALRSGPYRDLTELAAEATARNVSFRLPQGAAAEQAAGDARRAMAGGLALIDERRRERERLLRRWGGPAGPLVYLIVATGDIHEDVRQAVAAARGGADVIAVIRSTGQSLLDYVPHGATREGYAGTYATQENFRLMRVALDEVSAELGRYVRLTNYASGLCMPEMAVLAGLERLDMMLNDSMYGILFRDINPVRTFVDQRFSRQLHARAGIVINTGEDNYLTTADAMPAAHTVTASQLLNEYFGKEAGLTDAQLGLGHAFEIDPQLPDSFRMELAHALLARELFPDAPLKWMPPTRHMTGDIFRGYLLNGFFNLAGALTRQNILLVGMMTEAVVTPFLSDRDLALQNVRYVLDAAGSLQEDFWPAPGGVIARRAGTVLKEAVDLLEKIRGRGLLEAIAAGTFGGMRRPVDGGRGREGVVERAAGYRNPAVDLLETSPAQPSEGEDRR
jgi:beta-lysine 5,6-aminomutase alpha subunit